MENALKKLSSLRRRDSWSQGFKAPIRIGTVAHVSLRLSPQCLCQTQHRVPLKGNWH